MATGLSAFIPIVHAATIFPYSQLDQKAVLRYPYVADGLILVGTCLLLERSLRLMGHVISHLLNLLISLSDLDMLSRVLEAGEI